MTSRSDLRGGLTDGVFFSEDAVPNDATVIKDLDLVVRFRQNLNLTEIKKRAAVDIKVAGGNCLLEMKYGQRAKSGFWSNGEQWYLKGKIINLPD